MRTFLRAVPGLTILVLACAPADGVDSRPLALEPLQGPAGVGSRWSGVSPYGDGVVLSWLEPDADGGWALKAAAHDGEAWSDARIVSTSGAAPFFVNWADFPSVVALPDGSWGAHWLARGGQGTYDYGVRFARSSDGGVTWSDPITPHEDGTPTEHGFVTLFPDPAGGFGMVWLDGRYTGGDGHGGPDGPAMTVRYRSIAADGTARPEEEVDGRACDCCQTDVAVTSAGPVMVYRDRSPNEIRDIYVARRVDGAWLEGQPVHRDGWEVPGCPVNGPAIDARTSDVAVAWFSAGQDTPRVQVAFSSDAGARFGEPVRIDRGRPLGRVDVRLLENGNAFVTWLEQIDQNEARILAREVTPVGEALPVHEVATTSPGRDAGFPRTAQDADGRIVFTWTETDGAGEPIGIAMVRTTTPIGATQ